MRIVSQHRYFNTVNMIISFTYRLYLSETIKPTYFIQSQLIWLIKVDDDTAMFEVPYLHFLALASFKWLSNSSSSKHYIESQPHSFTTWYPTRTTCLLFELWLGCSSKTPYSPKTHLHPTSRHGTSQKTKKISIIALQTRAVQNAQTDKQRETRIMMFIHLRNNRKANGKNEEAIYLYYSCKMH